MQMCLVRTRRTRRQRPWDTGRRTFSSGRRTVSSGGIVSRGTVIAQAVPRARRGPIGLAGVRAPSGGRSTRCELCMLQNLRRLALRLRGRRWYSVLRLSGCCLIAGPCRMDLSSDESAGAQFLLSLQLLFTTCLYLLVARRLKGSRQELNAAAPPAAYARCARQQPLRPPWRQTEGLDSLARLG